MKKLIFTLLIFFVGINCFANASDDLQGEWKRISIEKDSSYRVLAFSNNTLTIDDKCYTYKINNHIIEVYSPDGISMADFYIKLISDIGDDNLTVAFINRETGKWLDKRCTYILSNV